MNKVVRDMLMRRRRDNAYRDTRRDMNYDSAYDMTYDRAYDKGYDEGYDTAYDRAYTDGYDRGYDRAHNELTPYGSNGMTVSGYEHYDGRRGVKGTGRYGIGGSRYYGRRDRGEEDMTLSTEEMKEWKKKIGEHFTMPQIEQSMRTMDIQPKDFTPEELCMTANMLYSDYDKTLSRTIPKEKEVNYYTSLARDFLDDKDASVKGGEKLAAYYACFVNDEE